MLFSSPSAWDSDPVPPEALTSTDTTAKADEFRQTLVQDILKELRDIAASLPDDEWKYEGDAALENFSATR